MDANGYVGMSAPCQRCAQRPQHGELWTGLHVSRTRYVWGHYGCVMELLGPELLLRAIQRGFMPNVNPDLLVGGMLPKFLARRPSAFAPRYLLEDQSSRLPENPEEAMELRSLTESTGGPANA